MPVRRAIPYNEGLYFITFTCYKWLSLIEYSNGYDIAYRWFDYLKTQGHNVTGYVIMPNHLHALIFFTSTTKGINKIVGDGKRFMAYEMIKRLKEKGFNEIREKLQKAVSGTGRQRGKKHEVWEESFDWKFCETEKFANQKLSYLHNNPCSGKWRLAADPIKYPHSSARFYISGKHVGYEVMDIEKLFSEKIISAQSPPPT